MAPAATRKGDHPGEYSWRCDEQQSSADHRSKARNRQQTHQDGPRRDKLTPSAEGRAWALDSAYFSRSGPRVVAGIEALAALLHPSSFPQQWVERVATRLP